MSTQQTFTRRYLEYLNDVKTKSVLGFDSILAWAAAIPTPSSIATLVQSSCDNPYPGTLALAIVNTIHARICISLGIQNLSNTSLKVFMDVINAVYSMSHTKRSFLVSLIPASITALGAFAYNTLVSMPPSTCELALGILGPSLLILMASLVAFSLFIPSLAIVLHTTSGTKVVKVTSDSPYYELLRLFAKSVNNPDNLALTYAIQDIANKVSLNYRIPHLHSMSNTIDGIPDQDVFERDSSEYHDISTTMTSNHTGSTPSGVYPSINS